MSQSQPQPPSPEPRQQNQTSIIKKQSIKILRGTIGILEGLVVKLEAEPAPNTTPGFLDNIQSGWGAVLDKVRSFLPQSISPISNTALTGMIAAIAVLLIWTTSFFLPGKTQPPEVASIPNPKPVPTPISTPPELTAPAAPEPVEVTPSPEPVEVEPVAETPSPEPESIAPVVLTPEQNLIASIQNQVAEISDHYADGLIDSIAANFQGSSLTVKVSDNWYTLKQSQQDKLADRMLERSRELDFTHLEITDPQGKLLARSPVVGNDMVILKRQA